LTPGAVFIENANLKVIFSDVTGLPEQVVDKEDETAMKLGQGFYRYQTQESGSYIFRAIGEAQPIQANGCFTIGATLLKS